MSARPSLFDRLYARRSWILAALLLSAGLSLWAGGSLSFDFTPQRIFESEAEEYERLQAFLEVFGRDDNVIVVHVASEDLFRPERLRYLQALHASLAAVPDVIGVDDLTTAWAVRPGESLPRPLLPPGGPPSDETALSQLRALATSLPLVRGRVVSEDGRAGLLVVRLDPAKGLFEQLRPIVHACLEAIAAVPPPAGVETLTTGIPVARVLIAERLIEDQMLFFPVCAGLFVVILWFIFRDLRAVFVPLFGVAVSLVYLVGLMGATAEPVNIINNVLPVLVFVIGVSDAIHLVARYRRELSGGRPQREALGRTVHHLVVACLLTSVTTAVGFGSLAVAEISILQRFGLYAALGVLIAYGVTVVLTPLVFSYLSPVLPQVSQRMDRLLDVALTRMAAWILTHRLVIGILGAAVLLGALAAASQVRVENNVYEAFPDSDPIVQANARIERDFGGIIPASIEVAWSAETDPFDPAVLAYLAELQAFLEEVPGFRTLSLLDLLAEWNCWRHQGDPVRRELPGSAPEARLGVLALTQMLSATGREELLQRLHAPQARLLRISAQVHDAGSSVLNGRFEAIEARLRADAARQEALGLRCRLSGDGPVASRAIDRLILDMFYSLILAFAIILPTMCLLLRSVRAGLVSMVPNVTPLLLTLGVLGLCGLDLRVTTVIVFTISLGLAVDDTIHFMVRFREEWRGRPEHRAGADAAYQRAIRRTFRGTGGAILTTSILLAAGYSALLLSNFPVTRMFALGMEITVLAAIVGDLVFLPVCLSVFKPFRAEPPSGDPEDGLGAA